MTPSPWIHQGNAVFDANGNCIAQAEGWDAEYQDEEQANLRAIAAVPLMIEALRNIENDDNHMPRTAWNMIQEALYQATGISK